MRSSALKAIAFALLSSAHGFAFSGGMFGNVLSRVAPRGASRAGRAAFSMKALGVGDTLNGALTLFIREEKDGAFKTNKYTASELFGGKRAVIFGVPGAFTPTCSETHLPGYVQLQPEFAAAGVDVIACVSVNDPFVMREWGKVQNVGSKVLLLSDGNGEFSEGIGQLTDKRAGGMGMRSNRYAMVLDKAGKCELLATAEGSFAEEVLKFVRK